MRATQPLDAMITAAHVLNYTFFAYSIGLNLGSQDTTIRVGILVAKTSTNPVMRRTD